jgi:hypothetical protein
LKCKSTLLSLVFINKIFEYIINPKNKIGIKLLAVTIFLIATGYILHYFIFSIYEINIISEPKTVFAGQPSEIKIYAKPINAMGWDVPFRTVKAKFRIMKGNDLVTVLYVDEENGFILLRTKGIEGKVEIYIDAEYSLFPSYFEIHILPKTV